MPGSGLRAAPKHSILYSMRNTGAKNTLWFQPIDVLFALIGLFLWVLTLQYALYMDFLPGIVCILGICNTAGILLYRKFLNPALLLMFSTLFLRYLFAPFDIFPCDFTLLFVVYAAALNARRAMRYFALFGAGTLTALFAVPRILYYRDFGNITLCIFPELLVLITFAAATVHRMRISEKETRLLVARQRENEQLRDAQFAVNTERTRIAREMHDIVAHTLSVVIAQADGGRYAAQTDPAAAQTALETISEMSRAALADIRSIIGVLRDPQETRKPLRPQPAADDLEHLVETVRHSGARISFIKIGTPQPLPVGLGNALYRICQEAVTNALKHAGPYANISVLLKWKTGSIILEITDDGRGAAAHNDGKGHGIMGMQERAALFGGNVEAGPLTGSGFKVSAFIPLPKSQTPEREKENDE